MKRRRSEEIAWAAGWFEGEGYFAIHRDRQRPWQKARPMIGIVNTDLEALQRFAMIVKIGNISGPRQRGSNKPLWTWQASGIANVSAVYQLLLPWLSKRRVARGAEVLAEAEKPRDTPRPEFKRSGRRLTDAHKAKLSAAHLGLKASDATRARMRKAQRTRRARERSHE